MGIRQPMMTIAYTTAQHPIDLWPQEFYRCKTTMQLQTDQRHGHARRAHLRDTHASKPYVDAMDGCFLIDPMRLLHPLACACNTVEEAASAWERFQASRREFRAPAPAAWTSSPTMQPLKTASAPADAAAASPPVANAAIPQRLLRSTSPSPLTRKMTIQ